MDRSVTVRYFKLESIGRRAPSFIDAIDAAMRLGRSPHEREREVGVGVTIRLERRNRRRGLLLGEVVRVQRENIPPEAQQGGLVPLGVGGLGHSVAFAFDEQTNIIAIQFDPRGVSLGRFLDYLSSTQAGARFRYDAILNEDAWERYNAGQPRSLKISLAAPENLEPVEGPAGDVIAASRRLSEIAHAPVITVEVSVGHRRDHLAKRFVDRVLRTFMADEAADSVRTLTVKTKEEGLPTDKIDFLNDLSRDQEVLDLPSDNHDENVSRRLRFIERSFEARLPGMRELYG